MKRIVIILKNNNNIEFNIKNEKILDKINSIFRSKNIIILKDKNRIIFLRPSEIVGIEINNDDVPEQLIIDTTTEEVIKDD
jgi:hypothetical protein